MNGIAELLSSDGYIITNKVLIKKFGLHSAVLIGELCAEYVYWKNQALPAARHREMGYSVGRSRHHDLAAGTTQLC